MSGLGGWRYNGGVAAVTSGVAAVTSGVAAVTSGVAVVTSCVASCVTSYHMSKCCSTKALLITYYKLFCELTLPVILTCHVVVVMHYHVEFIVL